MEFSNLHIENFGSIGKIDLLLNQPGLILVTGKNLDDSKNDSNGSGKSLLFEALCWCLWGDIPRELEEADDVINWRVGQDCMVSVQIIEGGHLYVVSRHRADTRTAKPNDLLLSIDGTPACGVSIKDTQVKIDALVGFDFITFCAMMPGTGVKGAEMTDKAIKLLLEALLETEQLSAAYQQTMDRSKELRIEISKHTVAHTKIRKELSDLEIDVRQLRGLEQSFEAQKREKTELYVQHIAELQADINGYTKDITKLQALRVEKKLFEDELGLLRQRLTQEILGPFEKQGGIFHKLKDERNTELYKAQMVVSALNNSFERFTALGPTCRECGQNITGDHIDTQHEYHKENLKAAKSAVAMAQFKFDEACEALASHYRMGPDDTELRDFIDMKQGAVQMLNDSIQELAPVAKLLARCTQDMEREQLSLAKVRMETHNFAELFQTKAEKCYQLAADMAKVLTLLNAATREEKLCKFWISGFSPAGIRSFMLDYVTPILNERAKYYTDLLTGGDMTVTFSTKKKLKTGDIKDEFNISVKFKHGAHKYKMSSAGERARADLVIAMALGDLATYRTHKQLPWRFLDEPFERVDDSGTDAIIRLLNDQRARYKTVFVVTHKASFKQLFTSSITVVKEKDMSRIEEIKP